MPGEWHGRIPRRHARVDHHVGDVEQFLPRRMPRRARRRLLRRPGGDDAHAQLLRAQGDVDVHVVDPRMREDPHRVARVERIALHDRRPVPLGPLEKEELVNPHLAGDAREEREGKLDHGVKADESSDARIHLLDRNRCVPAPERVHPSLGRDGVGHELRGVTNGRKLCCLDVIHHGASVVEPLKCKHLDLEEWWGYLLSASAGRLAAPMRPPTIASSAASRTNATGTIANEPRRPYVAPNTPVSHGRSIPPVSAITITMLNAVPDSCVYRSPTKPSTTGNVAEK